MSSLIVLDAFGKLAVFFIRRVGSEVQILGDVLAQIHNMAGPAADYQQRVIERMSVGIICSHRQGIAVNCHRMIIAAGNAEFVELLVKVNAIVLGRAVAD